MTLEELKATVRQLLMLKVGSPEWVDLYNKIIDAFEEEDEENERLDS